MTNYKQADNDNALTFIGPPKIKIKFRYPVFKVISSTDNIIIF